MVPLNDAGKFIPVHDKAPRGEDIFEEWGQNSMYS
jgi:hypothetical protein